MQVKYVWSGKLWEVSYDPAKVNLVVFGWENYVAIRKAFGEDPWDRFTHLMPDGTKLGGGAWPQPAGVTLPRAIGEGKSGDPPPFCWHNVGGALPIGTTCAGDEGRRLRRIPAGRRVDRAACRIAEGRVLDA